jgi:hypothetical protein
LRPPGDAIELLRRHRRQLALPGGDDADERLVDTSLLDGLLNNQEGTT